MSHYRQHRNRPVAILSFNAAGLISAFIDAGPGTFAESEEPDDLHFSSPGVNDHCDTHSTKPDGIVTTAEGDHRSNAGHRSVEDLRYERRIQGTGSIRPSAK